MFMIQMLILLRILGNKGGRAETTVTYSKGLSRSTNGKNNSKSVGCAVVISIWNSALMEVRLPDFMSAWRNRLLEPYDVL
jgi:hypothetical protein